MFKRKANSHRIHQFKIANLSGGETFCSHVNQRTTRHGRYHLQRHQCSNTTSHGNGCAFKINELIWFGSVENDSSMKRNGRKRSCNGMTRIQSKRQQELQPKASEGRQANLRRRDLPRVNGPSKHGIKHDSVKHVHIDWPSRTDFILN